MHTCIVLPPFLFNAHWICPRVVTSGIEIPGEWNVRDAVIAPNTPFANTFDFSGMGHNTAVTAYCFPSHALPEDTSWYPQLYGNPNIPPDVFRSDICPRQRENVKELARVYQFMVKVGVRVSNRVSFSCLSSRSWGEIVPEGKYGISTHL